jgi:tetratricopeptide (TPR) repeat protein/ABC-type dipeptide/oligopeptide/nickel transport system ATPase subunit
MTQPTSPTFFSSESAWPFLLRQNELVESLRFLLEDAPPAPRLLRVFGASGSGKSFLIRELIAQCAESFPDGAAIYVDTPQADLEASDFFRNIDQIISMQRQASRDSPRFVSKSIAEKWWKKKHPVAPGRLPYLYSVFRDLLALLPLAGPVLKAFFPATLVPQNAPVTDHRASFHFLGACSHKVPVLIALDNIQFLPASLREMIESELQGFGKGLRLIAIERTAERRRLDWHPIIADVMEKDMTMAAVAQQDMRRLIDRILPEGVKTELLAETIFRRSEGNLKSAWFQLKLIAERRLSQAGEGPSESYEDVIRSLRPSDQMVLRFIVFLLGGLTVSSLIDLCQMTHLRLRAEDVAIAIADLAALGLIVINGERNDRVKLEHEMVSSLVTTLTPEEEKQEVRTQLVAALTELLGSNAAPIADDVLYDRLIGLVHEKEVRASAALQSYLVAFIHSQERKERFSYLCLLFREGVYWDVIDLLPPDCLRILLDAVQKSSLFPFGLIATERLRKDPRHRKLAALYAAKYLVQLFRYEDATRALAEAAATKEKEAVEFNIAINLCQDGDAALIADRIFGALGQRRTVSEYELVLLRNSGHLFPASKSRAVLETAMREFTRLGKRFGAATTRNNLGIVELLDGRYAQARLHLHAAHQVLVSMDSDEIYQPLVNLGALAATAGDFALARQHLRSARQAVPRALLMDLALLDFNQSVLDLCEGRISGLDAVPVLLKIYEDATRTADIRFIEVVAWFTAVLESRFSSGQTTEYNAEMISRILEGKTSGLELLLECEVGGHRLRLPYILSPNWRY